MSEPHKKLRPSGGYRKTFFGHEIVANTRRLCLMNMFLHNIGRTGRAANSVHGEANYERGKELSNF